MRFLLFIGILFAAIFQPGRASAQVSDSVIIRIQVNTGLQFDIVRFNVKPGAKVKIIFSNTDDMDHNFLITKPGAREEIVMAALQLGEKGPAMDYIPKSDKVLWAIPVISPHQERSVSFTAPQQNGVFPYVCTYPGHGFLMYGAMYVTNDNTLPEITEDENIPPTRRVAEAKPKSDKDKRQIMHMQAIKCQLNLCILILRYLPTYIVFSSKVQVRLPLQSTFRKIYLTALTLERAECDLPGKADSWIIQNSGKEKEMYWQKLPVKSSFVTKQCILCG